MQKEKVYISTCRYTLISHNDITKLRFYLFCYRIMIPEKRIKNQQQKLEDVTVTIILIAIYFNVRVAVQNPISLCDSRVQLYLASYFFRTLQPPCFYHQ